MVKKILHQGFALPSIMIASVVMLALLATAISSVTTTRMALDDQYLNGLAREAAESGVMMAEACVAESLNREVTWSNSSPLKPGSGCDGQQACGSSCYVVSLAGVRSYFEVRADVDTNNKPTRYRAVGFVERLRTSNGAAWSRTSTSLSADVREPTSLISATESDFSKITWKDAASTSLYPTSGGPMYAPIGWRGANGQNRQSGMWNISGNGQTCTGGAYSTLGYLYKSTDGCHTWTQMTTAGQREWRGLAMSADGTRLIASTGSSTGVGYIFTSLDGGATWTQRTSAGSRVWNNGVYISADGTRMLIVQSTSASYISTSLDGGATWTQHTAPGSHRWEQGVGISDNGSTIAAVAPSGVVWTSRNGGSTWTSHSAGSGSYWLRFFSNNIIVVSQSSTFGDAYTISRDGGASWNSATIPDARRIDSMWVSSDGTRMVAAGYLGGSAGSYRMVSFSVDSGATWFSQSVSGITNPNSFMKVTVLEDGSFIGLSSGDSVFRVIQWPSHLLIY